MAVEVAGVWEVGWTYPLMEHTQWRMAIQEFGVERMNMAPITGVQGKFLHEYPCIEDILADRDLTPVFIDEQGEVELQDFEHPTDALYVLGRASQSTYVQCGRGHASVRIDTPGQGLLWPHQALAIVLYHRLNS